WVASPPARRWGHDLAPDPCIVARGPRAAAEEDMRSFGLVFYCVILGALTAAAGCTAPPAHRTENAESHAWGSKRTSSSKASHATRDDDDDDDATAGPSGDDDREGAAAPAASKFTCSGADIAAYADALVKAARQSCTSEGTGVVRNDNYQCVK